jgi:chemotaxis protein methyltransferase WspC
MTPVAAESIIIEILERKIGLDCQSVGRATVAAAISARCAATACNIVDYATIIQENRDEQQSLINEVIVPETWFFRDDVPFSNLADYAKRVMTGRTRPLRVLSIPCSTGEEPYSVAMALLNAGLPAAKFQIDAVDICDRSIATARQGHFKAGSFRSANLRYRDQFFTRIVNPLLSVETWQIKPEVQLPVAFHCANILGMRFMADGGPYDVVLCRNLIIYLTPKARQHALGVLLGLMEPDTLFIAGHAENLEMMDPRFVSIGVAQAFSYRRSRPVTNKALAEATRSPMAQQLPAPPVSEHLPAAPASGVRLSDMLSQAQELADQGELVAAAALCEQYLLRATTNPSGWVLLGTIRQAQQDLAAAEKCFARAVYCDPTCYQALMSLAMLLERRGDSIGAANMKRRAAKANEGAS